MIFVRKYLHIFLLVTGYFNLFMGIATGVFIIENPEVSSWWTVIPYLAMGYAVIAIVWGALRGGHIWVLCPTCGRNRTINKAMGHNSIVASSFEHREEWRECKYCNKIEKINVTVWPWWMPS
jgi:hypothetical protein